MRDEARMSGSTEMLPMQISVEFHYATRMFDVPWRLRSVTAAEIAMFIGLMYNLKKRASRLRCELVKFILPELSTRREVWDSSSSATSSLVIALKTVMVPVSLSFFVAAKGVAIR